MDRQAQDNPVAQNEDISFDAMIEDSFKTKHPTSGEIITGRVIQVGSDEVILDVGAKSEGVIPISEFLDDKKDLNIKVGDIVEAVVKSKRSSEGFMILSKTEATRRKAWSELLVAYKEGASVEGKVTAKVKGGYRVDVGMDAFMPRSQVNAPNKPFDEKEFIGSMVTARIIRLDRADKNVVLSVRVIAEEKLKVLRDVLKEQLKEGAVLDGVVVSMTDYGVFVDLGGMDGMIHISDLDYRKVTHPSEAVSIGDTVTVEVVKYNSETGKISLSRKNTMRDPWDDIGSRYSANQVVEGVVTSLMRYGAFVQLEPGVEGLVHVSEMSWTRNVRHPSEILKEGDKVQAAILEIDDAAHRISLGLKQATADPWNDMDKQYPAGTVLEGRVTGTTDFGLFVELEENIEGLVHINDISWDGHSQHPDKTARKGDIVKVKVLNIDMNARKISLGIKQLEDDPWDIFVREHPVGTRIPGTVTKTAKFGIFVKLDSGVEGLLHKTQLSDDRNVDPESFANAGDELEVMIVKIEPSRRKIGLSLREMVKADEREVIERINSESEKGSTLGDILDVDLEGFKQSLLKKSGK